MLAARLLQWISDPAGSCTRSPGAHRGVRVRSRTIMSGGQNVREVFACYCVAVYARPQDVVVQADVTLTSKSDVKLTSDVNFGGLRPMEDAKT